VLGQVNEVVAEGWVQSIEVPAFFRWLSEYEGVANITPAEISSGLVQSYAYSWAVASGFGPRAAPSTGVVPAPVPRPALPTPTEGQKSTTRQATKVTSQQVTAPGLTKAEAEAISKAVGISYSDTLRVMAATVDDLLPGMKPGQVPQALSQLNAAVHVLEHQISLLRAELPPGAHPVLAGTVTGVLADIKALETAVTLLKAQMADETGSGLQTEIGQVREAYRGLRDDLGQVTGVTLPTIETGLAAATGTLAALGTTVNRDVVPELAQVTKTATASAAKLALTTDECLAELCEAENQVTRPIQEGGASPSLLRSLGGLLGGAFTLLSLVGLADTVLAIIDAPVALGAIIQDTETLAGWAKTSANFIASDLSWSGRLGH
jgi:hypothetical protein